MNIKVPVDFSQEVIVTVETDEFIAALNELDLAPRMNHIAKIINEVDLQSHRLTDSHKVILKKWLTAKLDELEL